MGILGLTLVLSGSVFAQAPLETTSLTGQGMMSGNAIQADDHTAREEAEGKAVWEKFQTKQTTCADLSDEDFGVLGEYFMGQMMGSSHSAMNAVILQMHGEDGEEKIHIVMGKWLSGCDTSAESIGKSGGWMPMMNMMFSLRQGFGGQGGGWSSPFSNNSTNPEGVASRPYGAGNSMMNFGRMPFGGSGWIFMIFWWILVIAGIVALIKWFMGQPPRD